MKQTMRPWDAALFVVALTFGVLMSLFSMANVQGYYANSMQPVFIEQPWLAWMLAMLAPAASIALKFVPEVLESHPAKRRYVQGLYLTAGISFLFYAVLLAINFPGVADAGGDYGDFGDGPGIAATALAFIQLLAEITTGAALFTAAHHIYLKYWPDEDRTNPKYVNACEAVTAYEAELLPLEKELSELITRIAELEAQRDVYVGDMVSEFIAARARMAHMSQY